MQKYMNKRYNMNIVNVKPITKSTSISIFQQLYKYLVPTGLLYTKSRQ